MTQQSPQVQICTWPQDAPFAYSMTYDEGTVDALANALPVHQEFGFPGHVDVVAGQLGEQRSAYGSSLNDYMHMSVEETVTALTINAAAALGRADRIGSIDPGKKADLIILTLLLSLQKLLIQKMLY